MATYTPKTFGVASVGTSATDFNKPASAHQNIFRTLFISPGNNAGYTVNMNLATSTADAAGTRFLDTYALTQAVPYVLNGWIVADTTTWVVGKASNANVVAGAGGYDYA